MTQKTQPETKRMTGEEAYNEDVRRYYAIGGKYTRKTWSELPDFHRAHWEKYPTPRDWRNDQC
jgi:hypothetical protein